MFVSHLNPALRSKADCLACSTHAKVKYLLSWDMGYEMPFSLRAKS